MPFRSKIIRDMHSRHSGTLLARCRRVLRDAAEAEDALQETFLRAYAGLPRFEGDDYLPWLHRIALNVCIGMLRGRERRERLHQSCECLAPSTSCSDARLDARAELRRLHASFTSRDLSIVVAHYVEGMDQGSVAAMLGISRRAVVKRLTKVRECCTLTPLTPPDAAPTGGPETERSRQAARRGSGSGSGNHPPLAR